jgi:large subunit ribosomal protein L25
MAGERTKLTVRKREQLGSREARRLRRTGVIPGVLYGRGEPVAICVEERELRRALTGAAGLHSILDVQVDGTGSSHASILKEYQVDRVRGGVTHVDLQEVRLDQPITATVTVHLVGGDDAPGVKEGGVLSQPLREVEVEALPLEVPEHIDLDVSHMLTGETLRIADIPAAEGVTLLGDPDTVVEGAEAEGVAAPAEGEAPEGGSEAPAEPGADAAGEPGTVEG